MRLSQFKLKYFGKLMKSREISLDQLRADPRTRRSGFDSWPGLLAQSPLGGLHEATNQ